MTTIPAAPPPAAIFVVDDDPGLLRVREKKLLREGYRAFTASSAAAAIAWLRQHRADLLLLDLQLADMAGRELIEQLARAGGAPPFIVITGQGDERVAVDMMKRGALDYLVKDNDFLTFLPAVTARALRQLDQSRKLAATERELRLIQAAVQQAQDAIIITTSGAPEPVIVYANAALETLTGLHPAALVGQGFSALAPAIGDLVPWSATFAQRQARVGEAEITRASGGRRAIEWQLTPVHDTGPEPSHWVAVLRDVTERHQLQAEILEVSGREQRRIGQDLHDGLGQHLAGIELMSQVLEQRLAGKHHAAAEQAARIASHVREAIAQTRSLARGLSPVESDPNGLISALQNLAHQFTSLFRVPCDFQCPDPVLIPNQQAATHLYRIAQEATHNALKHAHPTQLRITLERTPAGGRLSVKDNGPGMKSPAQNHHGMGLRIMRHRAEMIGARLDLLSAPRKGLEVVCTFPLSGPSAAIP